MNQPEHDPDVRPEENQEIRPLGAIFVVAVVTVFIVTFWLFHFFTHLARS